MATTKASKSVESVANKITVLEAGFNKDFTAKNSLTLSGTAMTQVQILAQLGGYEDLYTAVATAKSALKVAEAALTAALPGIQTFIEGLVAAVKGVLGPRSPLLADFGIAVPTAKAPRTAAQKAVSAALMKQTKAVRGIIGAKQRAKITVSGTPGIVVVGPNGAPLPVSVLPPTPPGVAPGNTGSVAGSVTESSAAPASGSGSSGPATGG
jgi:hypothetical protein